MIVSEPTIGGYTFTSPRFLGGTTFVVLTVIVVSYVLVFIITRPVGNRSIEVVSCTVLVSCPSKIICVSTSVIRLIMVGFMCGSRFPLYFLDEH